MKEKESDDNTPKQETMKGTAAFTEDLLQRIFDSELLGLFFWDSNGKITEANNYFLKITGYTRQELNEGKIKLSDLTIPEHSSPDHLAIKQMQLKGISEPFEKEYIKKDGNRLLLLQGGILLKEDYNNTYAGYIININNITRNQKQPEKSIKDMEYEISQKTEQLETVNAELESLSYSISHDLRAPLRAVNGYSQMLKDEYEKILDKDGLRLLNNIVENARAIGELIDNILQYSRLGRRLFNPALININKVVNDALNELNGKENVTKKIIVHDLGQAIADYSLIKEVFIKLIDNAIKFSSKKENPRIEIGIKELDNNKKAYYVKDNGAGFDMTYHEKLFKLFQRLHKQEDFGGKGISLAVAKRIISRHGGKIWAEGKLNEGAAFYFTLSQN